MSSVAEPTMKHTSGPWKVCMPTEPKDHEASLDVGISGMVNGEEKIIAECFGQISINGFTPASANARLIAVAPELLAVCKQLLSCVENEYPIHENKPDEWPQTLVFPARAAIAKAEGGAG